MDYQFRNALNGFNKEDVVAYLEATNQAHQAKLQRLQNQILAADERYAELQDREQEYVEKISDLEAEISTIKIESGVTIANYQDGENNTEEIDHLREEMEEYKRAAKDCTASMTTMQEEYEAQMEELEWQLKSTKEKYEAMGGDSGRGDESEELIELENQVRQLKGELADAKAGAPGAGNSDIENELRDEIYVLEDEVTALTKKIADLEANGASNAGGAAAGEIENELRDEIYVLEDEVTALKKKIEEFESAPQATANSSEIEEELRDEINVLEDEVAALKEKITQLESVATLAPEGDDEELNKVENELKTAQIRLENMAKTIDELETALDENEMELKQVKAKLESGDLTPPPVVLTSGGSEELDSAKLEISSLSIKLKESDDRAEDAELKLDSMTRTIADLEFTAQGYDARTQQLLSRLDNAERENQRLVTLQAEEANQNNTEQLEAQLKELQEKLAGLKETEEDLQEQLFAAEEKITALEAVETVPPEVLVEKEALEEKLKETQEKLAVIDGLETKLKEAEEQLRDMETIKEQLAESQKDLQTQKDLVEEEKKSNHSLKSQLDEAQEELHTMSRMRTQLREAQEELESLTKVKSQLREVREELESMSRVKSQLREAQEELDAMSKVKIQLKDATEELEHCAKYKPQLAEAKEEIETLSGRLTELENRLKDAEAETVKIEELETLKESIDELEMTLGDEKRYNATLITELDDLRVELTKRKNTEWTLQEELKKVQMNHDVLAHKVTRLEPPAKAYLNIKDRVETMEREAQYRAQETINQAESEVFRVQQQVEQWLARVNSSYSSLCKELDENIITVDQGLARASNALSQISSVIKTQDSAFSHLGRTISATSSVGKNHEQPAETTTWQATEPAEESNWQATEPVEETNWQSTAPQWTAPPPPDWSTSTIPNSASPANWSTAPSPLPLEDISGRKPMDLYEELEALEESDEKFGTNYNLY